MGGEQYPDGGRIELSETGDGVRRVRSIPLLVLKQTGGFAYLAKTASHPVTASNMPLRISKSFVRTKTTSTCHFLPSRSALTCSRSTAREGSKARKMPGKETML